MEKERARELREEQVKHIHLASLPTVAYVTSTTLVGGPYSSYPIATLGESRRVVRLSRDGSSTTTSLYSRRGGVQV